GGEGHQPNGARADEHGAEHHRLAAVAVGHKAPERGSHGHDGGPAPVDQSRPEGLLLHRFGTKVAEEKRKEGSAQAESDDGQRLCQPQRIKRSLPRGHASVSPTGPACRILESTGPTAHGQWLRTSAFRRFFALVVERVQASLRRLGSGRGGAIALRLSGSRSDRSELRRRTTPRGTHTAT